MDNFNSPLPEYSEQFLIQAEVAENPEDFHCDALVKMTRLSSDSEAATYYYVAFLARQLGNREGFIFGIKEYPSKEELAHGFVIRENNKRNLTHDDFMKLAIKLLAETLGFDVLASEEVPGADKLN